MKRFTVPIFDCTIGVFLGGTEDDGAQRVKRWLRATSLEGLSPSYAFVARDDSKIALWMSDDAKDYHLAHECRHIASEVLLAHGIEADKSLEEIECLLIGWCFHKVKKIRDALETERTPEQKTRKRNMGS